jgi:hypothetical protein
MQIMKRFNDDARSMCKLPNTFMMGLSFWGLDHCSEKFCDEQMILMSRKGHPKFVDAHYSHIRYINGVLAWLGGPKSGKNKLGPKSIFQAL